MQMTAAQVPAAAAFHDHAFWEVVKMIKTRKQGSTTYPILLLMIDSADHITGKTGLTLIITLSKNGGAFAAAAGSISELNNGWYLLAGNATDRDTLGELGIHASAIGADPTDDKYAIVDFDGFVFLPPVDIKKINSTVIQGTGALGNLWRPQ
jgi:hypothetical protein